MSDAKEKMKLVSFAAGEVIFQEGDAADCAYVVKQGVVEVYRMSGGRKTVLNRLEAGQILGEMAVISNAPRSASAAAESPCDLVMLDRQALWSGFKKSLPIVQKIFEQLIERFKEKDSQLIQQASWNTAASIGHILLLMSRQEAGVDYEALSEAVRDILRIPQTAIDAVLDQYRRGGFLAISREDSACRVTVADPQAFRQQLENQAAPGR